MNLMPFKQWRISGFCLEEVLRRLLVFLKALKPSKNVSGNGSKITYQHFKWVFLMKSVAYLSIDSPSSWYRCLLGIVFLVIIDWELSVWCQYGNSLVKRSLPDKSRIGHFLGHLFSFLSFRLEGLLFPKWASLSYLKKKLTLKCVLTF